MGAEIKLLDGTLAIHVIDVICEVILHCALNAKTRKFLYLVDATGMELSVALQQLVARSFCIKDCIIRHCMTRQFAGSCKEVEDWMEMLKLLQEENKSSVKFKEKVDATAPPQR